MTTSVKTPVEQLLEWFRCATTEEKLIWLRQERDRHRSAEAARINKAFELEEQRRAAYAASRAYEEAQQDVERLEREHEALRVAEREASLMLSELTDAWNEERQRADAG